MREIDNNFETRILYSQSSYVDESVKVKSNVCACSYTFKGTISPVTARCRLTIVYSDDADIFDAKGGTIEKWSDQGWQVVDEFFDSYLSFGDVEDALNFLLHMFKSFMLGAPLNITTSTKPFPSPPSTKPEKIPKLRVLEFAKEQADSKKEDSPKKSSDKETPDFDWI